MPPILSLKENCVFCDLSDGRGLTSSMLFHVQGQSWEMLNLVYCKHLKSANLLLAFIHRCFKASTFFYINSAYRGLICKLEVCAKVDSYLADHSWNTRSYI